MILIVDDIPANLIALKKVLNLHDLTVDTAESGEEALLKTLKNDYSLIILDVQMPGMDGFEVAETLAGSNRTKDIPILFLSAVSKEKSFISKGYQSGGADYITKPVDPDLLILKVKTFIKLYNQQQELKDVRDILSKEIEIRKKAQEQLAVQMENLRSALTSLPEIAFTVTTDGALEFVNTPWYSYSASASAWPEVHQDDQINFNLWQQALTGGIEFVQEIRMRNLETQKFNSFVMKLVPVKTADAITRWVGTMTDIQEQKEIHDNLEEIVQGRTKELVVKNEELEFKNHELQQFAWVVSHDLKEPIRKIEIFTKIIQDQYLIDNDKARHYSSRTLSAAQRMTTLITDLLEYSRLSSQVMHKKTSLNMVVDEVLADLDYQISRIDALVTRDNLPEIYCVSSQLRQVFQNLISNSLKFAKKETRPVISIKSERIAEKSLTSPLDEQGDFCRITVTDNGIGFDEKYLDKIFIIFQSLNDRKSYDGTGIGLAIAKKIIEKHSGLINANSKEGLGATFVMVLPLNFQNNHEI